MTAHAWSTRRHQALTVDVLPLVLTRMVFGMVNSVAEWYDPKGKLGAEDVANSVAELLFGGLRAKLEPITAKPTTPMWASSVLSVMCSILRQTFPLFCHGMSQENPDKFDVG